MLAFNKACPISRIFDIIFSFSFHICTSRVWFNGALPWRRDQRAGCVYDNQWLWTPWTAGYEAAQICSFHDWPKDGQSPDGETHSRNASFSREHVINQENQHDMLAHVITWPSTPSSMSGRINRGNLACIQCMHSTPSFQLNVPPTDIPPPHDYASKKTARFPCQLETIQTSSE